MNPGTIERLGATIGGIVVAVVAFYALYKDWKSIGVENQVFKLMLSCSDSAEFRAARRRSTSSASLQREPNDDRT